MALKYPTTRAKRTPRVLIRDLSPREQTKRKRAAYDKIVAWKKANPEKVKVSVARYTRSEKGRKTNQAWRWALRLQALYMYGGKCACCREKEPRFLAIDHINGGGSKHIRSFGSPTTYHRWLIKLGRRRAGLRVLCHNCNMARAHWGSCPHGNGI